MVGTIFLALALALSLCALLCYGARTERMERYGRWLTVLSFAGSLGASIYLLVLIFGNHFEIAYVASYSSAELPAVYKFSAFWAGQQGSFLLWLLFHAAAGVILGYRQRLSAVGMCVYMVLQTLLTILVLAKSPFLPQEVAVENGVGLNPLLQDPWMAVHPPIIFLGYALLAVPFACSAAALIEGQMAKDWLETARRWALVAWAFLGAGIFIGGYWAYKVLGWGGFWGWDPVENSSLVPWLVAGIFIHVLRVARVRAAALSMVHLAAVFAFSLVLYGTFLTRSGILGDFSVHSFSGTSIGMTIAVVNALVLVGGLLLLTVRAGKLPQGEMYPAYESREFLVLLGALLLVFLAAVIFLGMSMPLLTQLLGKPAAVDTDFYVRTTLPLAIVMMVCLVGASLHRYGEGNKVGPLRPLAAFVLLGAALAWLAGVRQVMPLLLAGAALMGVAASFWSWRRQALGLGGMLAHAGLGLSLLAIVLSGSGSRTVSQELAVNEPVTLYGHEIVFKGQQFADDMREKYYIYTVDGREVRALTKLHANGEDAAREPAIDKTLGGDIYIAPTPPKSSGRQELILKHGRMDMDDLFAYRFEGVSLEEQGGGKMLVKAVIAVTDGDTIERVEPAIQATQDGGTSKAVEVFGGQKRIRLTGVAADQKQVRLEILPSIETETQQAITASVSIKPYIWLLWLGSVLVCAGTLTALKK
ncbi:cytochrome c-type biogenesis protein CcmF [Selenomonas ruminantium]|uniref:Cytochrome c-type biogenesis protein CcmF n=1 Tax=Selenomonas ruminantium TaxID=971 RepID=A0A1I3DRJ9_SELRU|nr:cytochrome c biogenesis protein CcsA [Selenomonas ruminantium]SFH89332.1 cytochrome c-type biogenesis protein CcmF [Selenomonas ruminantium]